MRTGEKSTCPYCTAALSGTLSSREMMLGTGEPFTYRYCGSCGALVLRDVPPDMSRFYPPEYYSLSDAPSFSGPPSTLKKAKFWTLLRLPVPIADRLPRGSAFIRWLAGRGTRFESSILDVGCGSGYLLVSMAERGFANLTGVDPYLPEDRDIGPVRLRRAHLQDVDGKFDVVMIHHTLEHVVDPLAALRDLAARLASGGTLIVRVPLADSDAADFYGPEWVALDPPRHVTVPTARAIELAAGRVGLRLIRSYRDSTFLQFAGSEAYRRREPLSAVDNLPRSQIRQWEQRAKKLNVNERGDAGCFIFTAE